MLWEAVIVKEGGMKLIAAALGLGLVLGGFGLGQIIGKKFLG